MDLVRNGIGKIVVEERGLEAVKKYLQSQRAAIFVSGPIEGEYHIFYDVRPIHENELAIFMVLDAEKNHPERLETY